MIRLRTERAAKKSTCTLCAILALDADTPMLTVRLLQFILPADTTKGPISNSTTLTSFSCMMRHSFLIIASREGTRVPGLKLDCRFDLRFYDLIWGYRIRDPDT